MATTFFWGADVDTRAWDDTIRNLQTMRDLSDDWDGNGAIAPLAEVIANATEWAETLIAKKVSPPSSVMAGPNGTILFNWQDEAEFLDAEFTSAHRIEWMQVVPGRPTQHGAIELDNAPQAEQCGVESEQSHSQNLIGLCAGTLTGIRYLAGQGRATKTLAGTI